MNALRLSTLVLMPALLLAACGGGDDDSLDDRLDLADPKVRFVHAAPLAPDITLQRNDQAQAQATDAGYEFASQYWDISTDTDKWDFVSADVVDTELGSVTFDAHRGDKYTLVALPGDTDSLIDTLLIEDPFNRGLATEKARVRILNASPNAQDVDVYLTDPVIDIAGVQPNFPAVAFKEAQPPSGDDSAEFEEGAYQLRITNAGTKDVIFSAPVTIGENDDWLLLTLPGGLADTVVPGDIKVLLVKSDDTDQPTVELESQD